MNQWQMAAGAFALVPPLGQFFASYAGYNGMLFIGTAAREGEELLTAFGDSAEGVVRRTSILYDDLLDTLQESASEVWFYVMIAVRSVVVLLAYRASALLWGESRTI